MLVTYLFREPIYWILPLIVQILSYIKILKKMGKRSYFGIIPFLGEMEMSKDLFHWMRSFWRPMIVTAAMFLTAEYIGDNSKVSIIMRLVALIVYGIFLIRLYSRLSKQFGKGRPFALGLILMPIIFLPILAFGKSTYLGKREFKPAPQRSAVTRWLIRAGLVGISIVELMALLSLCFFITFMVYPAKPIVNYILKSFNSELASVTDSDEIVGRDSTLGADYQQLISAQRTRDYYFPDHSSDKKVVVMEYIIGSDLENTRGFSSLNISQMIDSTSKGDALDFVIQAGGSKRWFTGGIEDSTVGRYHIHGGELEEALLLPETTCMSEPEALTDFIVWAKENYPADRYILILWDHGGGFASGYGVDDLNKRSGQSMMAASEIIGAIDASDMKFDIIGMDACLMQNVEFANAFEPFADYYLASEESEPGTGWFYTAGFGKLAANPGMSSEDLGKSIISSYDQCNRTLNKGKPQPANTLSMVDLTLIKPVYSRLEQLYDKASDEIAESKAIFSNMSAARSKAYEFQDYEQVDLIGFLTNLKKADYNQQVMSDERLDDMIRAVKACIVYRNIDSADGINGIATDFPYESLGTYSDEYEQLKAVNYKSEQKFFDRFCSIMASQRMRQADTDSFFGMLAAGDYSNEDWYIKGFEDYDTSRLFIDIPVTETPDGYLPELPEKTWASILDCRIAAYVVTEDGLMYIGKEHFDTADEAGHPLVRMDNLWTKISGHPVCYEADTPVETENKIIYRGRVRARLNNKEEIILHIEWDPEAEDSEEESIGRVTGYSKARESQFFFMKKGLEQFESGDTIEFLFDYYDEEGNIIKTKPYGGKLRVISGERLTVADEPFEPGTEIQYFGVLTDIYQRDLITEELRAVAE